jgi:hypothetical protein
MDNNNNNNNNDNDNDNDNDNNASPARRAQCHRIFLMKRSFKFKSCQGVKFSRITIVHKV